MIINEDDYLEHFGVKGMKWGVRRKAKRLTKLDQKTNFYKNKSDAWNTRAKSLDRNAKELGPIGYGKQFNKIQKAKYNSKQLAKYSEHYRKKTESYINKLSKKYIIKYDVTSKTYNLVSK